MRFFREGLLSGAFLLIGLCLGALVTVGAGGAPKPAPWFWPLVGGCGVVGLVLLLVWVAVGHQEIRLLRSAALAIDFTGEGTPCVVQASWRGNLDPRVVSSAPPSHPTILIRLRVRNVRKQRIDTVQVAIKEIRRTDGGSMPEHYPDFLKWMHDDTPDHPESLSGLALDPERPRYMDLAWKILPVSFIWMQYARDHLRTFVLEAGSYFLHVEGTARDADTQRPAPVAACAFELGVDGRGALVLAPKTLDECGFSR
jgi:hypothetical protein